MKEFIAARPRSVLLASSRQEDGKTLTAFLQGTQWMPIRVATWRDALKIMSTITVHVMLCDRHLPGLEGPNGLAGLQGVLRFPALLLLSDATISNHSEDVLRFGALNVLSRPFSREILISALEFARTHWQMQAHSRAAAGSSGLH